MSSKPISELTELTVPLSTDVLAIVNSFETKKVTVASLLSSHIALLFNFDSLDDTDSPYTVVENDVQLLIDTTGGDVTVNLPLATSSSGRNVWVKNSGTGEVVVDGSGVETIDGELTQTLSQYSCLHLMCDGSNWWIL